MNKTCVALVILMMASACGVEVHGKVDPVTVTIPPITVTVSPDVINYCNSECTRESTVQSVQAACESQCYSAFAAYLSPTPTPSR